MPLLVIVGILGVLLPFVALRRTKAARAEAAALLARVEDGAAAQERLAGEVLDLRARARGGGRS